MKCLSLHSVDIAQDHTDDIGHTSAENKKKSLSFLGPKIWSKIDPSIKNVRTLSSFIHATKKNILLHLQN